MYYFNDISDEPINWRSNFDIKGIVNSKKRYESHWADPLISWSQLLTKVRIKLSKPYSINGEQSNENNNDNLKETFNKKGLKVYEQNRNLITEFCKMYENVSFLQKKWLIEVKSRTRDTQ